MGLYQATQESLTEECIHILVVAIVEFSIAGHAFSFFSTWTPTGVHLRFGPAACQRGWWSFRVFCYWLGIYKPKFNVRRSMKLSRVPFSFRALR